MNGGHVEASGTGRVPAIAFREAALRNLYSPREQADVLRLPPAWVNRTVVMLISLVVVAAVAAYWVRVPVYAEGLAVVMAASGDGVTAPTGGRIDRIDVFPGEFVRRGDVLLSLSPDPDRAEGAGGAQPPTEPVVASMDGIVSELRIRVGQRLERGEVVLLLRPRSARVPVLAVFPGSQRPLLVEGQPVTLRLTRHPAARAVGRLSRVGAEMVGPEEIRRFLGPDVAGGLPLAGPVTLAWIDIDAPAGSAIHDGIRGTASVHVGESRLVRLWVSRVMLREGP